MNQSTPQLALADRVREWQRQGGPFPTAPAPEPCQRPQSTATGAEPLPANIDAEKAILGAILLDNDLFEAAATLAPDDFFLDSHRVIFRCIAGMLAEGETVDPVTLVDTMRARGELNQIGSTPTAYINDLNAGTIRYRPAVEDWARIVRAASRTRKLLATIEAAKVRVLANDPVDEVSTWTREALEKIGTDRSTGLHLLKGAEIVEREQPAILPDHIFDETAIGVHGRPGDGKTTLALLMAANVSVGRTPYTLAPCLARNVLVMSNEDSPARIRKLFLAAGGDVNRLWVEDCDDLWQLTDLARLEETIRANAIRFAIVDGLASHSGKADLNSHQDTSKLLVPLRALAEKYHCLILVIHHLNKSLSVDHIQKVAGSIGITASFRHNIHVVPDPENPELRLMVNGKSNLAPPNVPALRFRLFPVGWAGEAHISIDDVYRITEPDEKPGKAAAWLREALADGEWHLAGQLQQQAKQGFDLSTRSLFRAADTLGVERRKQGFGGRAEWRLGISAPAADTPDEPDTPPTERRFEV